MASSSSGTDPPLHDGAPASSRPNQRKSRLVVPADSLLTFNSYTPPPSNRHNNPARPRRSTPLPPRNRDAFVQANFRFAVSPTYPPGYEPCLALHDALVPWDAVDFVFVAGSNECPICLHPVRCPRVTPCGHVFDFLCILQHIHHASEPEKNTVKCPLCSCRVSHADLRPCVFGEQNILELGLPFSLRLVTRERGTMVASLHGHPRCDGVPTGLVAGTLLYSRLAFADQRYLLQLIRTDIRDLQKARKEEPHLMPFVDIAVSALEARRNEIKLRQLPPRQAASQAAASSSEGGVQTNIAATGNGKDPWFFYQASDTQNVFLHPVNHRCLSTEFSGDFSGADTTIEGHVLQIERHTMDDQLRKKYRFLGHLPDGCEFAFVELDLNHMLSARAREAHHAELRGRKASRKRKENQEKKETLRIEQKKTESLQNYFGGNGDYLARSPPNPEQLNSRDVSSFPALGMGVTRAAQESVPTAERPSDYQVGGSSSSPSGRWDDAEVSSYSSVTSKMGLFPSLGNGDTVNSPVRGTLPSPWFPTLQRTLDTSRASGSECNTRTTRQGDTLPADMHRKVKKSHRKTTILSNASVPQRR